MKGKGRILEYSLQVLSGLAFISPFPANHGPAQTARSLAARNVKEGKLVSLGMTNNKLETLVGSDCSMLCYHAMSSVDCLAFLYSSIQVIAGELVCPSNNALERE